MIRVIQESFGTILELGASYDSLDDRAIQELSQSMLDLASRAEPPHLLLDLTKTEYIGSSFIELMLRSWKRLRSRGGGMSLCGVRPYCLEVLKVTRLDQLWTMYATREEAVAALKNGTPPGARA